MNTNDDHHLLSKQMSKHQQQQSIAKDQEGLNEHSSSSPTVGIILDKDPQTACTTHNEDRTPEIKPKLD